MFSTPILLITFNRPQHTRKVLERILEAKPRELYIFQDGAREGNAGDIVKCAEVRKVIEELTSSASCSLHLNYSPINLGCGPGPAAAISWFFSKIAPHTDDIWFWVQEIRCGIKAEVVRPSRQRKDKSVSLVEYLEESESTALYFQNCFGGRNNKEMYALLEHYNI